MQAIEDKQRNDRTEWQSRRFVTSETKIGKYKLGGILVFQRASEGDWIIDFLVQPNEAQAK
jgi:hypothetical protein